MGKKEEYKLKNEQFLQNLRTEEGVKELAAGVLYRILESGQGSSATPCPNSIVSVHYKGTLINGREFDNSWKRNCPEAFRLNEVIDGWQIACSRCAWATTGWSTSRTPWDTAHAPAGLFRLSPH